MLRYARYGASMFLAALLWSAPVSAGEQPVLRSPSDDNSYEVGVAIVRKMKELGGAVNLDLVIQGMKEELTRDYPGPSGTGLRNATVIPRAGAMSELNEPAASDRGKTASDGKPAGGSDGRNSGNQKPPTRENAAESGEQGISSGSLAAKAAVMKTADRTTGASSATGVPAPDRQDAVRQGAPQGSEVNVTMSAAAADGSLVPRRYQTPRSLVERRAMRAKTIAAHRAQQ